MTIVESGGPGVTVVRPPQLEHDPAQLDAAAAAHQSARVAWEDTAGRLDVLDGRARRGGGVDQAEHRAAVLAEQGARDRLNHARRIHQECQVVELVSAAAELLPDLAGQVHAARDAASAALDAYADAMTALNHARRQLDADIRAIAGDESASRLHLSGNLARYQRLPGVVDDPPAHVARLVEAAVRRARS